jgi:hypothetical protein
MLFYLFLHFLIGNCLSLGVIPANAFVAAMLASSGRQANAEMPHVYNQAHKVLPKITSLVESRQINSANQDALIDNLTRHLRTLMISKVKRLGNTVHVKVAEREAERLVSKLKWVPGELKPKTREVLKDRVYDFIKLAVAAKTHKNPIIRNLGNRIQDKVISMNPNPKLAASFFNTVNKIKDLN